MKSVFTAIGFFLIGVGSAFAQGAYGAPGAAVPVEAGFQSYDPAAFGEAAPSAQPGQVPGAGVQGQEPDGSSIAAVINEMGKLDNARALKAQDYLSFRIVEEGAANAVKRLRINESGTVNVPHLGMVSALGKTCYQLAVEISGELQKDFFNKATVIIVLDSTWKDRNPHWWHHSRRLDPYSGEGDYITVFGQVGRQGRMNLPAEGTLTISSAILQAGGFARFANAKNVRVLRKMANSEKERRVIVVDVDSIMRRGYLNKDIELKKDDVIIVPEKLVNF